MEKNAQYFDRLVGDIAPVRSLHDELVALGTRIEYFPGATSPETLNGDLWATADWHHDESIWRLYFPVTAKAHAVYHEQLHARFKAVDGAPMMKTFPASDPLKESVGQLNNDLDHAYVVPREVAQYPEAAEYWEKDYKRFLGKIPSSGAVSLTQLQRKSDLLRAWLVLPVAMPDSPITQAFRAELVKDKWLDIGDEMSARVQAAGADKVLAIHAFREALGRGFPPVGRVIFTH